MKSNLVSRFWCGVMLLVMSAGTLVQAHPGHELSESSVSHVISSPYHLLCLGLLGGFCLLAAKFTASVVRRKALVTAGCCLIAGGLLLQVF